MERYPEKFGESSPVPYDVKYAHYKVSVYLGHDSCNGEGSHYTKKCLVQIYYNGGWFPNGFWGTFFGEGDWYHKSTSYDVECSNLKRKILRKNIS